MCVYGGVEVSKCDQKYKPILLQMWQNQKNLVSPFLIALIYHMEAVYDLASGLDRNSCAKVNH